MCRLEPMVSGWVRQLAANGLSKRIAFLSNDPVASKLPAKVLEELSSSQMDSLPLNSLPEGLQSLARQATEAERSDDNAQRVKDDQVMLREELFMRWILPDGRALHSSSLNTLPGTEGADTNPSILPLKAADLPRESAVEISPQGADSAAKMIKALKDRGVEEIWLDTTDPAVLTVAIASGAKMDLVVRPWRQLIGETLSQPDIDVVGLNGEELANLPTGRLDPDESPYPMFSNTFAPTDPNLETHWQRLLAFIPKKGLHRIVVLDPQVGGYRTKTADETFEGQRTSTVYGQFTFGSLVEQNPALNDFGYLLDQRLRFLRAHHVDPIDVKLPQIREFGVSDVQISEVGANSAGTTTFLVGPKRDNFPDLWAKERKQVADSALKSLTDRFADIGCEICFQSSPSQDMFVPENRTSVKIGEGEKAVEVRIQPAGPAYSEDADGNIVYPLGEIPAEPVCFDFRMPSADFEKYVNYFFAAPKKG